VELESSHVISTIVTHLAREEPEGGAGEHQSKDAAAFCPRCRVQKCIRKIKTDGAAKVK